MLALFLSAALATDLPHIELAGEASVMCLANGMRLGVLPQRDRPLAAVALAISKGASEEGEHHGLAHLVEHLTFEVRNDRDETRIAQLEAIGASYNALTDHDSVVYLSVAHRRSVRGLLELEVERLRNPLAHIDEESFAAQRAIVRQELAESSGDHLDPLTALALELLPAGNPYTRTVGGTDASVAALDLPAAQALAEAHYRPEHAALVLMGDFDADLAWRLVEQALPAEWLADKVPCKHQPPPQLGRADWDAAWPTVEAAVDEPVLAFGWALEHSYSGDDVDFHLGVIEEAVDDAGCTRAEYRAGNLVACFVPEPKRGHDAVIADLDKLDLRWSDLSHDRARGLYSRHRIGRIYLQQQARQRFASLDVSPGGTLATMTRRLALYGLFTYSVKGSHDRLTLQEVQPVWTRSMGTRWLRGVHLVPGGDGAVPSGEAHTGREPLLPAAVVPTDAQIRDRVQWPDLSAARTRVLASGARVTWLPGSETEAVAVLQIESPAPLDPWQWTGARLWLGEPWAALSDSWQERAFGAFTFPSVRPLGQGLELHTKSPKPMIAVAALTMPAADLPLASRKSVSEQVDAFEEAKAAIAEDPESLAWAAILDALGGEYPHPWLDDLGRERVLDVKKSDARALFAELAVPEHMHLAMVGGRLDWDVLVSSASTALDGIDAPRKSSVEPAPPPPPPPSSPTLQVVDARQPKSTVMVACRLDSDDALARELLETHLHATLNDALRGQLSLTYGVEVRRSRTWMGHQLWVETSVPHDATGPTVAAIRGALETVANGEIAPDRLQRLKYAVASDTARRYQTPDDLARLLLRVDWDRLEAPADGEQGEETEDEPPTYADSLIAITPDSLGEVLGPCAGRTQTVVVGLADAVDASLAESGLHAD